MQFNYQASYKQFRSRERRFVIQAFREGMKKEDIREIVRLDWEQFKSERRYCEHNQRMEMFEDPESSAEQPSPLQKRFIETLTTEDRYLEDTFSDILLTIGDKALYKAMSAMTEEQQKLLYEVFIQGNQLSEIADENGVSRAALTRRMNRIRTKLLRK